ncbi:alpha/beta fold hydrolase [Rhodococcoides yunnanense]|uniref:alpha/beta fold hydrolase n=1 Tax=Rhodococcoides yunnanense TaxID=278209 RepID=UPI000AF9220B|nr:alpha/beta hydrolase [Rhodococcus yunnanensis]
MTSTSTPDLLYAEIRDGSIAYVDSGAADGTIFVLSHSLFFDHTMFTPLTALLVDAGHRVVAYDHRGQGASSPANLARLSMDELTEDAAAFIEHLDLGPVHFLGNSMGGFIALRLATRRPELLLSAIAASSSAEEEHQLEAFAPLVDALHEAGAEPVVDTLMHIMFGDTSLATGGPVVQHWRGKMAALPNTIADSADRVIHRDGLVEELAECGVPVLAISGSEDHAYPPPLSDEHIAAATDGTFRRVPAAGHSVSLEQPQTVFTHLIEHLAAVLTAHT